MSMTRVLCLVLGLSVLATPAVLALTIYDIQYATAPDYNSPYLGQTVSVSGGIVTKIFMGGRPKVTIQDPTLGDAWAGVQVVFNEAAEIEGLAVGDLIDLTDVVVDEYRGNTQLGFETTSVMTIVSSGHTVLPLVVSTADIPYPADHDLSEKYEFMLLTVENVEVGTMDLGKNADNYELTNGDGTCWASDYANADLLPGSDYYVSAGQLFSRVTGYLEQYLNPDSGWDYYQLLPRDANDYVLAPTPAESESWGSVKALFR